MPQIKDTSKIIVWRFTDGKVGHEKQSQALLENLQKQRTIESVDIPISHSWLYYLIFWLFKLKIKLHTAIKEPNLVIGAGHRTHLAVLAVSRYYRCKSLIIMSPSLPKHLFDAIVAPRHDYLKKAPAKNVIITPTALSPQIKSEPDPIKGLILLGGESSHYHWNDNKIALAVKQVIQSNTDDILWKLSTSRRTPSSTVELIYRECERESRLEILNHQDLPKNWLSETLKTAGNIVVTPDSASMISEALMSNAAVSLLELSPKDSDGKIHEANRYLAEEGFLNKKNDIKSINRKKIDMKDITKKIIDLLEL